MSDNTGLPFDPDSRTSTKDKLILFYKNNIGNFAVLRKFERTNGLVRETEVEFGYKYPTNSNPKGEWEETHRFNHSYTLAKDNETLVGDGSNWDGDGRNWKQYFKERCKKRLNLRFPNDNIEMEDIAINPETKRDATNGCNNQRPEQPA